MSKFYYLDSDPGNIAELLNTNIDENYLFTLLDIIFDNKAVDSMTAKIIMEAIALYNGRKINQTKMIWRYAKWVAANARKYAEE